MSEERSKHRKKTHTRIEVSTPVEIEIITVLLWIGGLTGLILGTLTINQGFYEPFIDMQILLLVQGIVAAVLGAAMFITGTGIMNGAVWSLDAARRVAGISIAWAAIGIGIGVYTVWNLETPSFTYIIYGLIIWLAIFAIGGGFMTISQLSRHGTSIRKFAKYVTTEVVTPEDTRIVTTTRPVAHLRRFCWHCGAVLHGDELTCPKCGSKRDVDK